MKIAVLGTGPVGRTLGRKLVSLGHSVALGSRTADNRGMEKYLPLWLRLMGSVGKPAFNIRIVQ
jgi:predicted dinucleotide-binding enzyme